MNGIRSSLNISQILAAPEAEITSPLVWLHFGAHRTASTWLQACVGKLCTHPANPNWHYIGPGQIRKTALRYLYVAQHCQAFGISRAPLGAATSRVIGKARSAKRIFLSDECFIGSMSAAVRSNREFYPTSKARIDALNQALPNMQIEPLIVIRSYESWLRSAHKKLSTTQKMPQYREIANEFLRKNRSWYNVASEIADVFGACTVVDYQTIKKDPRIVFDMIGLNLPRELESMMNPINMSPDWKNIGRFPPKKARMYKKNMSQYCANPEGDFASDEFLIRMKDKFKKDVMLIERDERCNFISEGTGFRRRPSCNRAAPHAIGKEPHSSWSDAAWQQI